MKNMFLKINFHTLNKLLSTKYRKVSIVLSSDGIMSYECLSLFLFFYVNIEQSA